MFAKILSDKFLPWNCQSIANLYEMCIQGSHFLSQEIPDFSNISNVFPRLFFQNSKHKRLFLQMSSQ